MALDHSRINLPLSNRANDAQPKRCPLEEIHPTLFYLFPPVSCDDLLVSYSLTSDVSTFLSSFSSPSLFLSSCFFYVAVTAYCCLLPSFRPGPPQSPDPQTEDPSGTALGVGPDQRTQWGRRLRRCWGFQLKDWQKKLTQIYCFWNGGLKDCVILKKGGRYEKSGNRLKEGAVTKSRKERMWSENEVRDWGYKGGQEDWERGKGLVVD